MGVDGVWWFFKVEESDWTEIKPQFDRAAVGVGSLPEVKPFILRSVAPPVTPKYAEAVVAGVLAGAELGERLFHRPFHELVFKLLIEKPDWQSDEHLVEFALQSRVLPTVVLMTGIGYERFAQLPGYLGNMLLHRQEVASALELVSQTLDVDWQSYSTKAKCTLDYGGPPGSEFDLDADADVAKILHALPNALQKVKNDGAGLLVLSSWDFPDTDTPQNYDPVAESDDIEFF
ncbi:hypothetical protein [Nostoc sp. 'Peltigera membranacea cyanobiont' 210A]|uniref:hypothetical protein n=1 Tax=Nostoc sp. 'Peltigera membranacea cyanobiont' 210A TaxID=2014529 RepID=UPI00167DB231|nr:hypothetical protein [Nostoc sp. 'Peltigera membranacea cyanobiont' 210A]